MLRKWSESQPKWGKARPRRLPPFLLRLPQMPPRSRSTPPPSTGPPTSPAPVDIPNPFHSPAPAPLSTPAPKRQLELPASPPTAPTPPSTDARSPGCAHDPAPVPAPAPAPGRGAQLKRAAAMRRTSGALRIFCPARSTLSPWRELSPGGEAPWHASAFPMPRKSLPRVPRAQPPRQGS